MKTFPQDYDAWRLRDRDGTPEIGMEDGEVCNRCPEPDEDAPRGYRPKPCPGVMVQMACKSVICDGCWELAE